MFRLIAATLLFSTLPSFAEFSETPPANCSDKAAVAQWFRDWRENKRLGLALVYAKTNLKTNTPALKEFFPRGASCIKDESTIFAERAKDGDYLVAACLMQSRVDGVNQLTHLFKVELLVNFDDKCLSDKNFHDFAHSPGCQNDPNAIKKYLHSISFPPAGIMPQCWFGPVPLALRGPPKTEPMSVGYFNQLFATANASRKENLSRIIEAGPASLKVKMGVGPHSSGGSVCAANEICWPTNESKVIDSR